jgi:glycosyltransferase involved in cell wall biosynthesis
MRVAHIVSGFSPSSSSGLDQHTLALTQALVRLGVGVEVLVSRNMPGLAPLAQRREMMEGVGVTWLNGGGTAEERDWSLAIEAFLERECPDLVHLETMPGAGNLVLEVIQRRGIPVLHNAWDMERVAKNAKALAVDLMPFDVSDMDARARDRLAQVLLAQHPELGQHGGHVLPAQVDDAFWEKLQELLSGVETPALTAALGRVDAYDSQTMKSYTAFSGRFAASRWLSRTLSQVSGARVEYMAPGVDVARFQKLSAPHAGSGKVRFGFMGSMDKASGAHLLIDAFCGMAGKAELRLFGASEDRLHLRTLRANAERVEARWYGAVEGEDRVHAMERIDVLVVPSLWQASAPHEIREAFAARRPVIVCDLEAPSEMVVDGQNGLHFAAGDMESLRAVMQRFIDQPTLLDELELGVKPQREISEEARQWADIYAVYQQMGTTKESPVPGTMAAFAERYHALKRLPTRELFQKVARGLTNLSGRMGVDIDPLTAVTQAVAQGGRGRDERLGAERIRNWLETSVTELEETRKMLLAQDAEQQVERAQMSAMTQTLEGKIVQVQEDLSAMQEDRDRIERERDALQAKLDELGAEVRKQSVQLASVEEQQDWLRGQVLALATRVLTPAESSGSDAVLMPVGEIKVVIERIHAALHRSETEMTWRQIEMNRAQKAPTGFRARYSGKDAQSIMQTWDVVPVPRATDGTITTPPNLGEKEIPAAIPSDSAKTSAVDPSSTQSIPSELEAK